MNAEVNKRTQCGWRKMSGVLSDKRIPKDPQDELFLPVMMYGMETVPMSSYHAKKLEVTQMKMCRCTCGHTLRDHVRNDDIRERLEEANITKRCRKETEVLWTREDTIPRIHRKKDSEDGTTWEKKARKTEAGMDGLCQPRHDISQDNNR